jgi:hypothetical protein
MEHIDIAISMAKKHLRDFERSMEAPPLCLSISSLQRFRCGYMFTYATTIFLNTWNDKYLVGGNSPFIVDVENNVIHEVVFHHSFEFQKWLYCRYRNDISKYYYYLYKFPKDREAH